MLNGKANDSPNTMLYSAYRLYSVYIQLSSCIYQDSVYSVAYSVIIINSANTLVYSVRSVSYSDLFKLNYSAYSVLLFRFKSSYSISRLLGELN